MKLEEKLEEAKRLYKDANADQRYVLEYLFPELAEIEDVRIKKEIIEYIKTGTYHKSWIDWIEKQGKQKLADKVEPKFHEGDWILYSGDHYEGVRHITKIDENGYYIERNGLPHGIIPFNHEICMRLWTIKDAKDGDILAAEPIYNYSFPFIGIYKERGVDFFNSHCFIGFDGNFYNETTGHVINNIHPATKEQRDTLMKTMTNAGWEFDFEKKELRKIEQKSTKWSEEDNEMIFKICQNLYDYPRVKSPFDRESFNEAEKEVQFIKSIRPQNQWKPTEEQMKALAEALSLAKNCGEESAFDLRTLYEQLKNL